MTEVSVTNYQACSSCKHCCHQRPENCILVAGSCRCGCHADVRRPSCILLRHIGADQVFSIVVAVGASHILPTAAVCPQVDVALQVWQLVLAGRFRLLDRWCEFVQGRSTDVRVISEDQWRQVRARGHGWAAGGTRIMGSARAMCTCLQRAGHQRRSVAAGEGLRATVVRSGEVPACGADVRAISEDQERQVRARGRGWAAGGHSDQGKCQGCRADIRASSVIHCKIVITWWARKGAVAWLHLLVMYIITSTLCNPASTCRCSTSAALSMKTSAILTSTAHGCGC